MAIGFGPAISDGERTLVPIARSFLMRLPGSAAGLVWNRPTGIWVEERGASRFLRVRDRTRQIQWLLLATGLALAGFIRIAARRRRRRF